jgi:hypothetical protein
VRTTEAKPTLARELHGDPALAARLADALDAQGREERLTHGFHAYPAGLHPDTARDLLALFPEGPVLDLFCGGGTVLVEALAAGRPGEGRDISEVARLVAIARTTLASDAELTSLRSTARDLAARARSARTPPPPALLRVVGDWYEPHVLAELEALRRGVDEAEVAPSVGLLLLACFSSVLVKASHRASESSARRVPRPRPPGTTAILFHKKARELGRRLEALRAATPAGTIEPRIVAGDARQVAVEAPVGLILTSPPYPSVYDYLPMQALREAWLGTRSPRAAEIGPRRAWRAEEPGIARRRWLEDTAAWTGACARALAPGGHLVVVIGDGLVEGGPVPTREPTVHAARIAGLEPLAGASLLRPDHARASGRWEHALAFRSPG